MDNGFTLNQHHCSEFNITMISKILPVLPAPNDAYIQFPERDGSIVFPGGLSDGSIAIECGITTRSASELMVAKRQISTWIYNKQRVQLIFDDETDKYWSVKYVGEIGLTKLRTPGWGTFTLIFRAEPYALGVTEQDQTINVAGKVTNAGSQTVEPLILLTVSNAVANVTVTNNTTGDSFSITSMQSAGTTIEVDSGYLTKKTCKINGVNGLGKLSGKFLTLAPGDNQLTISNSNVTAQVKYRAKWL